MPQLSPSASPLLPAHLPRSFALLNNASPVPKHSIMHAVPAAATAAAASLVPAADATDTASVASSGAHALSGAMLLTHSGRGHVALNGWEGEGGMSSDDARALQFGYHVMLD
jgi:hypothetical protein